MKRHSQLKGSIEKLIYKKPTKEERLENVSFKKSRSKSGKRGNASGKIDFPFKTIHGIPLVEMDYTVPPKTERKAKRSQFKDVKYKFMKFMAENHQDQLKELGFSDEEINYIKDANKDTEQAQGRGLCPKRYNVHHKLPIHGGGKNEFSNFIIMPIDQHDDLHHKVIDLQIMNIKEGETRKIFVPWTDRNAHISTFKIPNFDKSQDFEGMQSGHRKISRTNLSGRIYSPSMEGEFDDKELKEFTSKKDLVTNMITKRLNGRD